jgi:hypothetical protein
MDLVVSQKPVNGKVEQAQLPDSLSNVYVLLV